MTEATRELSCSRCGEAIAGEISPSTDGKVFCRKCTLELASEIIADSKTREEKRKEGVEKVEKIRKGRSRIFTVLKWVVCFMAAAFLIYRIPVVTESMKAEKPLRYGTYETDALADECISTLWKISDRYIRGEGNIDDLRCPLSGKPYEVEKDSGTVTAYCPNPILHGLTVLKVSNKAPVPVVK